MGFVKKNLLPLIIFVGVLAVYIHNLSRATYGGDVGDLLNAAATMGVAHAPGYPLFTLLGFLLSRINFISPAFMIGLISTFSGAFGVLIFYFLSLRFTGNKSISVISALLLGFSYYFWFYSEMAEVFALNNFFALLLFLLAFVYSQKKNIKYLFLLAFTAGLSLTNHHTILFIFPSLLILVLPQLIKDFRNPKTIFLSFLFGLLGFLPYIYIPIASSHNPPINWDHVHDLDSFIHLVLRKDYGTFSIGSFASSSAEQKIIDIKIYFFNIFTQATIPASFIIFLGFLYLLKTNKKLLFSFLLAFILSGPFFIYYSGFPFVNSFNLGVYERFISLSFIIYLMLFPFGLLLLKKVFDRVFSKKGFSSLLIPVFIIIPLMLFRFNYPKTDLSSLTAGDDVAYDLLSPLPKDSMIFVSGDTVLFNTWYVHFGKNFRSDVQVVNINGVTENNFFKRKQENYLKENPNDKNKINSNVDVTLEIAKTTPVFSVADIEPTKGKQLNWVPYGISNKLFLGDPPSNAEYKKQMEEIWKSLHIPKTDSLVMGNLTIADIPLVYSNALVKTGNYFFTHYGDKISASEYYQKALQADSNNPAAFQSIGNYYLKEGNCGLAQMNLSAAIDLDRYNPVPYFFQYYNYVSCFKDQKKAKILIEEYNKIFKSNFLEDLSKTIRTIEG